MKIVIATPLYPPDIADPAPYVKDLARRLSSKHQVVIVTYGTLPEEVPGVRILCTDKRRPALVRIAGFTHALRKALRSADLLLVQSGISAEIPALIAGRNVHTILRVSEESVKRTLLQHWVRHLLQSSARTIQRDKALDRPEILPFAPYPTESFTTYEAAWEQHIADITTL